MTISVSNMFSFQNRTEHTKRKRLIAPAYSKSSMCAPRVQGIIRKRVQKLVCFLDSQTASVSEDHRSDILIPRNIFRAMAVDIITAFALSESASTDFLDRLRNGPNTMREIGMDDFALWNQDERDECFFFESQPEFKPFLSFFAPEAQSMHARMEVNIARLIQIHKEEFSQSAAGGGKVTAPGEQGPYSRLFRGKNPLSGESLGWHERASEILDHIGMI